MLSSWYAVPCCLAVGSVCPQGLNSEWLLDLRLPFVFVGCSDAGQQVDAPCLVIDCFSVCLCCLVGSASFCSWTSGGQVATGEVTISVKALSV